MESETKINREIWLEYISKLNDRALNRQRASGLTTWAIACVVAVLLVKSLFDLPAIINDSKVAIQHLLAATVIIDLISFCGAILLSIFLMSEVNAEVRLKSRLSRTMAPFLYLITFAAFAAFAASNFFAVVYAPAFLSRWPFVIVGLLMMVNAFGYPLSRMRAWFRYRKNLKDLPELSSPALFHVRSLRILFYSVLFGVFLIGFCIAMIPAIQSLSHITTVAHVNTIIWSLYIVGSISMILLLCYRLAGRRFDDFLIQLERRIIVESLPADVIRSEFIREFIGEDIREWLLKAEYELKRFNDSYLKAALLAEDQFRELSKLDRTMKYEIVGRKKSICEALKKVLHEYYNYADILQKQIEHLAHQNAPVAAPDLFQQVLKDWKQQLHTIDARHQSVCKLCEEASGEIMKENPCSSSEMPRDI